MTSRMLADLRVALMLEGDATLGEYVVDSARCQDAAAALDDARRVMANPMDEVRAWLVADLHAMGKPDMAAVVAVCPATARDLYESCQLMYTDTVRMLSPRTRAALGIGG